MIKDPPFESVSNAHVTWKLTSDYAGIGRLFGSYFGKNPNVFGQVDDAFRYTRAPETVYRFIQSVRSERRFEEAIVGSAIGPFDGELYLWIFIDRLNTDLTRDLFALKAAIEQQVEGEFEIHVEPLGDRQIDDLLPNGYVRI